MRSGRDNLGSRWPPTNWCRSLRSELTSRSMECPFCTLPTNRVPVPSPSAIVGRDAYPISAGPTLRVPVRHVASFLALRSKEQSKLLGLLDQATGQLDFEFPPDAYSRDIDNDTAAGQTSAHVHPVPRHSNDRADRRGGVRWIVPAEADYSTPRGTR